MYEFHGWVKLLESPSESDEGTLEESCANLKSRLDNLEWASGSSDLLLLNGEYILTLHAVPNRRRSEAIDLQNLLKWITENFKGAYGLIYEYDEQLELDGGHGVYTVNVIKRGSCTQVVDPYFSPVVPIVEDP